ncbi:MAG: hypothetical protein KF830_13495 [Planctomycetes bacterium]|nr:hypothetical protein [Planctomycetota bacterium]
MSQHGARSVEAALARLRAQVDADPRLHAECQRARREFLGGSSGGAAAERRFEEWFLLERDSETLGATPSEVPSLAGELADLAGSMVGVFLVRGVDADADEGVEAIDLQDDQVLDLAVPAGSLRDGDLLVGRLYPGATGQWTPSSAAAVFRPGGPLAEAFRRDVDRLGLQRRLQQVELEHLLLRRSGQSPSPTAAIEDGAPLEHIEADLEALLRAAGCRQSASAVSAELKAAPRPGSVIGPLLDEWAFDTEADLEAVRLLLHRLWNAHHAGRQHEEAVGRAPASSAGAPLGERLARLLEEGLRRHQDVEDLFAQVERIAGIDPEDEADDDSADEFETDPAAAAVEGDLAPLVQEYLWETGRDRTPAAATLQQWVELQGNAAVPHTDLEQVNGSDLLRLLVHSYLAAAPGQRAAQVRGVFAELERFYAWAASTQDLTGTAVLAACRAAFVDQVERFEAASSLLSSAADGAAAIDARPVLLQVEDVGRDGFGVRDDEGENHWLAAPPTTTAHLRTGDLLVGAVAGGAGGSVLRGPVVVLPADARTTME